MIARCEILEASNDGDNITIAVQGKREGQADWRAYLKMSLQVPDTEVNRRTYYLGRIIKVEISPV